jgi:hypothetical protein
MLGLTAVTLAAGFLSSEVGYFISFYPHHLFSMIGKIKSPPGGSH